MPNFGACRHKNLERIHKAATRRLQVRVGPSAGQLLEAKSPQPHQDTGTEMAADETDENL